MKILTYIYIYIYIYIHIHIYIIYIYVIYICNIYIYIYQQNLDCLTESIETGMFEHGTFSSDSIEKKVIATKNGVFYFTIGYKKQVQL